jgi:hypothetical protein
MALRLRDKNYLRWLATSFPCVVCDIKDGTIVAHHVRAGQAGGMGLKPGDDRCIPICNRCHMELHEYPLGEKTFLDINGVDYEAKTKELYERYKNDEEDDA